MDAPTIPDFIPQDKLSTSQPTAAEYTPSGWLPVSGDAGQWHAVGSIAGPQPFEMRTTWRRWLKRIGAPEHAPAEPVGVPQLPEGWTMGGNPKQHLAYATGPDGQWFGVTVDGNINTGSSCGGAVPVEVAKAVLDAAHRARGVR